MLKRYAICRNCRHWRQGVPSDMREPALEDISSDTGVCEMAPAALFEVDGQWVPFQPTVHFSRSCADFDQPQRDPDPDTDGPDDGPDDPDDGERYPNRSRVRHLFPIRPAPAAA